MLPLLMSPQNEPRRAIFSLKPLNDRTLRAANHPFNRHMVSQLPDGSAVLDVGFHIRTQSRYTLATMGRNADIFIEGSSIARVQCSFEIHLETGLVMLYDRSNSCSTQVFGENATPFISGHARKVVLEPQLNTELGIGGIHCDLIQFRLIWHKSMDETERLVLDQKKVLQQQAENPCQGRTWDDNATVIPSVRATRVHTPCEQRRAIRYRERQAIGIGAFGTVSKAVNVDTGQYVAVKELRIPDHPQSRLYLKREIEILALISHPNIIEYLSCDGWSGPRLKLIMAFKEGNLQTLITQRIESTGFSDSLLHQMLKALDCLAFHGLIHRDVKPENILFSRKDAQSYTFQLADFGLCNYAAKAYTQAGTDAYMAPEVRHASGAPQTSKIDVWSLFATLAYVHNASGFRDKQSKEGQDITAAVVDAIKEHGFHSVSDMAQIDPSKRASAAQMLVKLYRGHGLTTPLAQVKKIRVLDCPIAQSCKRKPKQERGKNGSRVSKRPSIAKAPKHTAKTAGRLPLSQKIPEMFNALR